MLTVEMIMRLNAMMIGRGAPIERDNIGYNRPDFVKMYDLGMLVTAYTPEECYVTLEVLRKYRKTQLAEYADDIEETFASLKEHMEDEYLSDWDREMALESARNGNTHRRDEYAKETIITDSIEEDGVFLRFKEFVEGFNPRQYEGFWGASRFYIPFTNLSRFIVDMGELGRFGYEPDEALLGVIDKANQIARAESARKELEMLETEDAMKSLVLKDEKRRSVYGIPLYSLPMNNQYLAQKLWEGKEKALAYVDTKTDKNKILIAVKDGQLERFKLFCAGLGIDISCFEKKKHRNESNRTLVDVETLDLPFKPYEFQIADAKEIVGRHRALIGHDMGCGKTFIATLVGISIDKQKLVICPESLRINWERELSRFDKGADISVVYSKDSTIRFGKDWTIMGYNTATKFYKQILANGFDCVFVDEAHNCKAVNSYGKPASKRAEAVINITLESTDCYLLTGTPMPTRNKDLYNSLVMLGLIDRDEPYSFHNFGLEYCGAEKNHFGWDYNGSSNIEELNAMLNTVMTRRLKKDVLPNLKKQRQFIPLAETSREYKAIEKQLYAMSDDDTYMGLAMTGRNALSKVKIDPAVDLAQTFLNAEASVVIVTEFNETMDALIDKFGDDACFIRGGMSDKAKQKAIDDFQNGEKKVCILNTIAGGVGITLTKAHNMIVCDYDWTPANMTQVEDRICRTGQTECCNIYYLYCENALLDRIFVDMITQKSSNIDRVIDNTENTVDLVDAKNHNASYIDVLKNQIKEDKAREKELKKQEKKAKPKKPSKAKEVELEV